MTTQHTQDTVEQRRRKRNQRNQYMERYLNESLRAQELLAERIAKIRKILELRRKNKWTLERIGNELGYTRERIRQIINKFDVN